MHTPAFAEEPFHIAFVRVRNDTEVVVYRQLRRNKRCVLRRAVAVFLQSARENSVKKYYN